MSIIDEINRSFNNHAFGMANVPGDGRNLCKVPAQGLAVIQAQNENANRYRAILVSQIEHWRTASGIRDTQWRPMPRNQGHRPQTKQTPVHLLWYGGRRLAKLSNVQHSICDMMPKYSFTAADVIERLMSDEAFRQELASLIAELAIIFSPILVQKTK